MDQLTVSIVILVSALILSAFFSSAEAAFLVVRRVRLKYLATKGIPGAQKVSTMVEKPERLLSTILLGNNLVNTAAAAIATALAISFLGDDKGVLVATIGVTIAILIFGEMVPKTLAVRHSERIAFLYARPLQMIENLLLPVVVILQWITTNVASLLGSGNIRNVVTEEHVKAIISVGQEEGALGIAEAEMLENVFRFGDRRVREIMTPRLEIDWIEKGTHLSTFFNTFTINSHTRFPVYENSVDNVIGILSVKDVVKALAAGKLSDKDTVTEIMRTPYFVPETKMVASLFEEMRQLGIRMVMVADEYGGVAGLVTMKQPLEEIVGPVGEEGRKIEREYEAIDENVIQVDGAMDIDEANDELGLKLPEGDYETVAGFLLDCLGNIPIKGDSIYHGELRFEITAMKGLKIEKVTIVRSPKAQ